MDKVIIFDTTLRDGEQSPGVALTDRRQAGDRARSSSKLGVDIIEAGFPRTSPGDFEAVQTIAREVTRRADRRPRAREPGRRRRLLGRREGRRAAAHPRLPLELATSTSCTSSRKDKETVLEMARTMVARAAGYCSDVEFSPMDATRSDREYVYWMLEQCIDAGATTVNIPDTVGYTVPEEFARVHHGHHEQRAEHRQGAHLRALPQRPRAGRRELAGGGAARARARSRRASTASASAPATPRSRRS